MNERWRWRGSVAMLAGALAFFLYPLLPNDDVINSDWPAFATGARLRISGPGHLDDVHARPRVQLALTGGRPAVTLGVRGVSPQLDGIVALGVGAAIALRSRPYLAGLALGLTLMKPQLMLPLAVAVILARRWQVLAGWAAAGAGLLATTAILNPRWVLDWLGQTR